MAKRILIVDDEEEIRSLLTDILSLYKYKTFLARDGCEALKKIKEEKIDLILLDIKMPKLDGYEFFKLLLEDKKTAKIPVIILTTSDLIGDINRFMDLGAKDYILKSQGTGQWLKKIKEIL